jgi:hypothetical protein
MPTEEETLVADLAYWRELAELVGWQLQGWSYRKTASYVTQGNEVLQLTGPQRDALVAAITHQSMVGAQLASEEGERPSR